jgi:hypothetical protein
VPPRTGPARPGSVQTFTVLAEKLMSSNSISVNELSLIAPLKNSWTQREWLLLLGLLAVTFGLYFQTHRFDFI